MNMVIASVSSERRGGGNLLYYLIATTKEKAINKLSYKLTRDVPDDGWAHPVFNASVKYIEVTPEEAELFSHAHGWVRHYSESGEIVVYFDFPGPKNVLEVRYPGDILKVINGLEDFVSKHRILKNAQKNISVYFYPEDETE